MASTWKTVRVFISSTFRDMHAERDHLIKLVFPALREQLERHRVHLVDIDLRWGVTKEQADNDQALKVCLDQIDACRPFFIGILGERYGHVSHLLPDQVDSKYGWIRHHSGKSITELEILYGVLNHPPMQSHALFLFRDNAFIEQLPPEKRPDFEREDTQSARKLDDLKRTIVAAAVPVVPYSCAYGGLKTNGDVQLTGLDEFGRQILQWLAPAIEAELGLQDQGATTEADPLAEESDFHERFMESRLRVYVGREQFNDALTLFVDGDEPMPCLVTGPSGSGKSAALARFVEGYQQRHPQALVVPHFIGASPASTNPRQMLRRFCLSLKSEFKFPEEIPQDFSDLASLFRGFLFRIPLDRRTVFVLDALNQLDTTDNAHSFYWLPRELPGHVKLIVSCVDDNNSSEPILQAFSQRTYHPVLVPALDDNEQRQIIRAVPSLSAKTLDDVQIDLLLSNPATSNPLFLLVALEELRGFGSFEQLDRRIAQFPHPLEQIPRWHHWLTRIKEVADVIPDEKKRQDQLRRLERVDSALNAVAPVADTLTAVFLQVIDRLECDFDPQISHHVLSLLASAKEGLSERELQNLLARLLPDHDAKRRNEEMQAMLRQVRSYLMRKGPLLDFYHGGFRNAVRAKHLGGVESQRHAHCDLAGFFGDQNWWQESEMSYRARVLNEPEALKVANFRKVVELPFHAVRGTSWQDNAQQRVLEKLLCDLEFVEAKCHAGMFFQLLDDYQLPSHAPDLPAIGQARRALVKAAPTISERPCLALAAIYNNLRWLCPLDQRWHHELQAAFKRLMSRGPWLCAEAAITEAGGQLRSPEYGIGSHLQSRAWASQEFAIASLDGAVEVHSAATGQQLQSIGLGVANVQAIALREDGLSIACIDRGGRVHVHGHGKTFDARTGEKQLAYHSLHGVAVVASNDQLVLWDNASNRCRTLLSEVAKEVSCLRFSSNGIRLLVVAGWAQQVVMVFTLAGDTPSGRFVLPPLGAPVVCAAIDSDGKRLLVATQDRHLVLFDVVSEVELVRLAYEQHPQSAIHGRPIACALGEGSASVMAYIATDRGRLAAWNYREQSLQRLQDFSSPADAPNLLHLEVAAPDRLQFFFPSHFQTRLTESYTPDRAHPLGPAVACSATRAGAVAIFAGDSTLRWYARPELQQERQVELEATPTTLAFCGRTHQVLVGMDDGTVFRYANLDNDKAPAPGIRGFSGPVTSMCVTKEGYVLAAGDRHQIKRLDFTCGRNIYLWAVGDDDRTQIRLLPAEERGWCWNFYRHHNDRSTKLALLCGTDRERVVATLDSNVRDVTRSARGNRFAFFGRSVEILEKHPGRWLWRRESWKRMVRRHVPVSHASFLVDDEYLVVARDDVPWAEIWELNAGLRTVAGFALSEPVSCLAADGDWIVIGFNSGQLLSLRLFTPAHGTSGSRCLAE